MLGIEQASLLVQVAAVLVPVALYFFLLGLLNSRSAPQLVRGRTDFICLIAAFAPIFCVPVLRCFGASAWTVVAVLGALVATAALLGPPRTGNWVIYNIAMPEAVRAAERTLQAMGTTFTRRGRQLLLEGMDAKLNFTSLPLLRNVSIAAEGDDAPKLQKDFELRLGEQLSAVRAGTTAMASAFLMISTAMLVAPLGLFADRVPEMVRLLSDLVK